MRQGGPTITAPISRKRTKAISSPIGIICAAIAFVFAFGGTLILAMAMISSSSSSQNDNPQNNNNDLVDESSQQGKEGALRNSIAINNNESAEITDLANAQGLIIHTHIGDIRIHFTPELAGESSVNYVTEVVRAASATQNSGMGFRTAESTNGRKITEGFMCQKCKFYRSEKQLLLQGIITDNSVPRNKHLGPCPVKDYKPKLECPSHDPNCGCHGPIMTKGMVGWAGGGEGPDFFINTFKKPVDWWENQHTVWGEIRDDKSMKVVESTYDLPAHMSSMRMLDQEIEFSLELF